MAIFEFTEETWVEIMWYVAVEGSDMIGVLFREGKGPWQLRYRFRHYKSMDDPWDDDDEKSVYDLKPTNQLEAKERLTEAFDRMTKESAIEFGGEVTRMVVRGNAEKACELLRRQPFAHTKYIPLPRTSNKVQ